MGVNRRYPVVAVVVDQSPLAATVRTIIEREQATIGPRAGTIAELESHLAEAAFDVAVVGTGSTRRERYAAFAQARAVAPQTPLVGIWPGDEPAEHQRALRAGIDGLVSEGRLETALGPTIRAALQGLACVPAWAARRPDSVELSSREKQIVGMAILGISNEEVARRLDLSESTVKGYLSSAYAKLGVHSRAAAAARILDPNGGLATEILTIAAE
jgi:DNA-binding NarL/FixJ family response regulator